MGRRYASSQPSGQGPSEERQARGHIKDSAAREDLEGSVSVFLLIHWMWMREKGFEEKVQVNDRRSCRRGESWEIKKKKKGVEKSELKREQ